MELQKLVKDLRFNQSYIYDSLRNHSEIMGSVQRQAADVSAAVSAIEVELKEAPQMLNIGRELDSLKTSLAAYEATTSDLKLNLAELKREPSKSLDLWTNSDFQTKIDRVAQDLRNNQVRLSVTTLVVARH